MLYSVFGPFDLPFSQRRIATHGRSKCDFWKSVDEKFEGLSRACGCYVFAMKAGKGALPWYVGRTKCSFKNEVLGAHQVLHYNEALGQKLRGKPQLFFIARRTPSGRFAKPHKDIDYLENLLISFGVERNQNLLNSNGTRYLKDLVVPGIFNSPQGMRTNPERDLRAIMKGSK